MLWVIMIHCLFWCGFFSYPVWLSVLKGLLLVEMPLFFFISGACNAFSRASVGRFYINRFQRIMIPYWAYGAVCVALIVVYSCPASLSWFAKLAFSWIMIPVQLPISTLNYLNWALWFIPVYLLVMLIFPLLRQIYKTSSVALKYFPLVVMAISVAVLELFDDGLVVYFLKMLAFYGFWTYLGLFYGDLFKSVMVKPALAIASVCAIVTILLVFVMHRSPDMQVNKFPPNSIFLVYSIGAMSVLYAFSDYIVNIIRFVRRNQVVDWIFVQYMQSGLVIFLFHPLMFLTFSYTLRPLMVGLSQLIIFPVYLLVAIVGGAVLGRVFSWCERIKFV